MGRWKLTKKGSFSWRGSFLDPFCVPKKSPFWYFRKKGSLLALFWGTFRPRKNLTFSKMALFWAFFDGFLAFQKPSLFVTFWGFWKSVKKWKNGHFWSFWTKISLSVPYPQPCFCSYLFLGFGRFWGPEHLLGGNDPKVFPRSFKKGTQKNSKISSHGGQGFFTHLESF